MKLDTLMAERIRLDAKLANVPRPIIDAVCSVFVEELATSVQAHVTTYELCDEVHTCCDCGQIVPQDDAFSVLHDSWQCSCCHGQTKTQPHNTLEIHDTTAHQ